MTTTYNSQQIAQTVLTFPDGLKSEITLWLEEDGYEISVEEEIHFGWTECESYEIEAKTEDKARKAFVLFVVAY